MCQLRKFHVVWTLRAQVQHNSEDLVPIGVEYVCHCSENISLLNFENIKRSKRVKTKKESLKKDIKIARKKLNKF